MTGAPSKRPAWVLTTNRGGSWFFAIFYTVFAAFEFYEAVAHGSWFNWVLGVGFLLLSVLGWVSLNWVLRHPKAPSDATPGQRAGDDDG